MKFSKFFKIRSLVHVFILTAGLIGSPALLAQGDSCASVFANPIAGHIAEIRASQKSEQFINATESEILQSYAQNQKNLNRHIEGLNPAQKKYVNEILLGAEFFDWNHTADQSIAQLSNRTNNPLSFAKIYQDPGAASGQAFTNFIEARNYLETEKPDASLKTLLEIHKRALKGGVSFGADSTLGKVRSTVLIGNVTASAPITQEQINEVNANKYLSFEKKGNLPAKSVSVIEKIKIWIQNFSQSIPETTQAQFSGTISYPSVKKAKKEIVESIKLSHPAVYKEVSSAQEKLKNQLGSSSIDGDLENRFATALSENVFTKFNNERRKLGPIVIGKNEFEYIQLVTDLQRDLVAIHPLHDGNGRSTRLLRDYLLRKEGLPASRVADPFLDIQVAHDEWSRSVRTGIMSTARLYSELLFRLNNGLPLNQTAELLYPGLPGATEIDVLVQNRPDVFKKVRAAKIDTVQFSQFVKLLMEAHPNLKQELTNNRMQTMSKLAELYVEYFRSKTVQYIHSKDGMREISLRLIEDDFVDLFAVSRANNASLWNQKIDRWYDRDLLVWRGLANFQNTLTTNEILEYFKAPTTHLVSNRVARKAGANSNLVQLIKEDFKLFNQEMLNGKLIEMAMDHHKTGPRYSDSYGFSTSKREIVGKAFAMGAMVVGEYGNHKDPAMQSKIKSRTNVAMYRSLKDPDLGRLRQFSKEFTYMYGRQAEVMGIGGVDPDAVALVQQIDAEGNVEHTFVRDQKNPNIVYKVKGRYVIGEGPLLKENILETHQLFASETGPAKVSADMVAIEKPVTTFFQNALDGFLKK